MMRITIMMCIFILILGSCKQDEGSCLTGVPNTFSQDFILVSENNVNIFDDEKLDYHVDSISFDKPDYIAVNNQKIFLVSKFFPQFGLVSIQIFHKDDKLGDITITSSDSNLSCDWGGEWYIPKYNSFF